MRFLCWPLPKEKGSQWPWYCERLMLSPSVKIFGMHQSIRLAYEFVCKSNETRADDVNDILLVVNEYLVELLIYASILRIAKYKWDEPCAWSKPPFISPFYIPQETKARTIKTSVNSVGRLRFRQFFGIKSDLSTHFHLLPLIKCTSTTDGREWMLLLACASTINTSSKLKYKMQMNEI